VIDLAAALRAQAGVLLALAELADQAPATPAPELVPVTRDGLRAAGFELRAIRRLAREGALVLVKVGRHKFVRRSDLDGLTSRVRANLPQPKTLAERAAAA
jgi:hypothetical protein